MTREEIKEQLLSQNHTISNPVYGYGQVMKSMDDYAKQEAIAFAKFVMENTFQDMNVLDLNGHPDKWEYDNGDGSTQSIHTEQLYSLFLEQKK